MLIGRTDLDVDLHREEYKIIKDRFFGSDIDKEEHARKRIEVAKLGEQLVNQSLISYQSCSFGWWTNRRGYTQW